MTLPPPTSDDPYREPSAPYAGHHPSFTGAPQPEVQSPARSRPSWVAWTALGLSALSFVVAMSVGILYAVNSFANGGQADGGGLYYDAGLPAWGSVDLTSAGAATERALTDSVEATLKDGIQDFDGSAEDVTDTYCEALAAPKKDSVATCSVLVQDVDSTVVLFFTDDDGSYLATIF